MGNAKSKIHSIDNSNKIREENYELKKKIEDLEKINEQLKEEMHSQNMISNVKMNSFKYEINVLNERINENEKEHDTKRKQNET